MSFSEFHKKMAAAHRRLKLKPGDIFEDCAYHPVLCLGVDYQKDEIWGVSLIDGTYPRSCSLIHCGVRRLTPKQAWQLKVQGPLRESDRAKFSVERRWWSEATSRDSSRVGYVGPRKAPSKPVAAKTGRAK